MKKTYVKIQKGKDLSVKTIIQINEIFQKEFPGNELVEVGNRKLFSNDVFFIVRDSKKRVLSVGRLRPAKVIFLGKIYSVQGIADIVSVIKKKGHGKRLMQAIHKYIVNKKQRSIGFCLQKNSPFYRKSGFKIAKDLVKRFIYKNPKGKIIKNEWDNDVLYSIGTEDLIEKILAHPKEQVLILRPFW
ncbi:GNAT family N-acetyltransferase [Candidatus Woesearchaeota archaeon]|nr:GNAT family N-acetyltransferase [Candidatus Woesearchaeota archaeon]